MQRLSAGQRVAAISASTWDRFVDAAEDFNSHRRLGQVGPESLSKIFTDLVDARNDTGSDRRGGDVVELGDPLLYEITNEHPWLEGLTPDETRPYGIFRKATESGKLGRCQVSGVVKAYVHVTDLAHKYAIVKAGSHTLQSAEQGAVRLLTNGGTGPLGEEGEERECFVLLGVPYNVFLGSAELVADMCEEADAALADFVGWKTGPCVLMPDPTPSTAVNLFQHQGMSGDLVWLAYDSDPEVKDWVVVGVQKHGEDIPVRVAFEDGCWVYYTKRYAMEKCSDDETRHVIVCGGPC